VRALDWIGRVLVLVLSALATFAIIASLVSVSAPVTPEPGEGGAGEITATPNPRPPAASTPATTEPSAATGNGTGVVQAPEARDSDEIARWLRALTYAVLGLAGFIAVLVIVAMRATAHLGAIADRR
jgi:hypothetical protein